MTEPSLVHIAGADYPHDELWTKKWKGKATIEIYLLSEPRNTVGNWTGPALYDKIYQTLEAQCPPRIGDNNHPRCWPGSTAFPMRYRKDGGGTASKFPATAFHVRMLTFCAPGDLGQIAVTSSYFASNEVRKPLIGAIAGAYEAMTTYDRNCFSANDADAGYRYCNVALEVKAFTEGKWLRSPLHAHI